MAFLEAVGRAQPATAIQNFQLRQGNILGQEKKRAVADLTMQNLQQDMDIKKRQQDTEINAEKAALSPKGVEPLLDMFEGGREGPIAKMVYEDAVGLGYIKPTSFGMGTYNEKSKAKIQEMMQEPRYAQKLSRTSVHNWWGQMNQAAAAAKEKPGDEKLAAEAQRTSEGYNQALGLDQAMSDSMAAQQGAGGGDGQFTLSPGQTRFGAGGKEVASVQGEVGPDGKTKFAPTTLSKLIAERQDFIDQGLTEDDPIIKAFDNKISGTEIDIEGMTKEEIDTWGNVIRLTGRVPSVGRGKQATATRIAMLKSAARQELGADADGVPDVKKLTPSEAALAMVGSQADTKAIQGSLNFLDKQLSSMDSFVTNLNSQIDRVGELSKDLKTFDTRLLNVPLRTVRGSIVGSPLQAKYDLFLGEIEAEIGKLAQGSPASIAELSASAQEKWGKIHDKNLSVPDMLELLEETKTAANLRRDSVSGSLNKARKRLRTRDFNFDKQSDNRIEAPQSAVNFLINNPQHKDAFKAKYGYLPGEQVSGAL